MNRSRICMACCITVMVSLPAAGAEFAWVPVEASGGYTISGNEIILDDGGQTVTLEIRMSGWDPDLDGDPRLGSFQATVDSSGYFGVNAVPPHPGMDLTPLGWPDDPTQGGFQVLKRCTIGGTPDVNGAACSLDEDCPSGETCVDNPAWVFTGGPCVASVCTANLNFEWGACAFYAICPVDDGGWRYGGTLILEVPADAVGTYTIGFNPSDTKTLMREESGAPIPVLALTPAYITIRCATHEECDAGLTCMSAWCHEDIHVCLVQVDPEYCAIGAVCYPKGTNNPENECEECNRIVSAVRWSPVVDGTACPDDDQFCNGPGICVEGACESAGNPCVALELSCDEDNDRCVECFVDRHCDDNLFCTGEEACVDGMCQSSGDPCPAQGLLCDEDHDACVECLTGTDCDDENHCTANVCDIGACTYPPKDDGTPCPDKFFCNGPEACVSGECVPGPDPCNDGVPCTVDSCFEGTDTCGNLPNDAVCNDGIFCNGVELCHVLLGCVGGAPPCAVDEWCDEASQCCNAHGNGQFVGVDIDLEDFAAFQRCFGEVEDPECYPGNMVGAGNVINLDDFAAFIDRFTGPQP